MTAIPMLPPSIFADALGSPSSPAKRGKLEERENEVDDFRRITSYEDTARGSRFLHWGGGMSETDFRISFQDGSWARLTSSNGAREIVALLGGKEPAGSAS